VGLWSERRARAGIDHPAYFIGVGTIVILKKLLALYAIAQSDIEKKRTIIKRSKKLVPDLMR